MANKDLFEQAIADAKKLREISLQQAKQKMEETFAPKIQEMFRLKLSEMEDLDEAGLEEEGYDEMDEMANSANDPDDGVPNQSYNHGEQNTLVTPIDEMSLDEILAELELEEGDEMDQLEDDEIDDIYESSSAKYGGYSGGVVDRKEPKSNKARSADHAYSKNAKDYVKEAGKKKGEEVEKADEKEEKGSDEVAELSIEEFKDLIRDVVADVLGKEAGADEAAAEDLEGGDEMGGEDLEGGEEGKEGSDEDTISLDEILADIDENWQGAPEDKLGTNDGFTKKAKHQVKEEESEELEEAISTIHTLKAQLSEINLLNAKLLYVNKLYKAKNLNEAQKVKVLVAFDRATTIKEAKNIYATLQDSIQSAPASAKSKGYIKESLGFASKPIGSAPAKPIVEADAYVYRMQQLAGLKQPNI